MHLEQKTIWLDFEDWVDFVDKVGGLLFSHQPSELSSNSWNLAFFGIYGYVSIHENLRNLNFCDLYGDHGGCDAKNAKVFHDAHVHGHDHDVFPFK